MIDILKSTFHGESVGAVFEMCLSNPDYRAAIIVNNYSECEEFISGIAYELKEDPHSVFSKNVLNVHPMNPMYTKVKFKNGSVLLIMPYRKPPTGSILWGSKFNRITDISDAEKDPRVERWFNMIVTPYRSKKVPFEKPGEFAIHNASDSLDDEEVDSTALDEFLDGFTIRKDK